MCAFLSKVWPRQGVYSALGKSEGEESRAKDNLPDRLTWAENIKQRVLSYTSIPLSSRILNWKHGRIWIGMMCTLQFENAERYRAHALLFDELADATSETQIDTSLRELVKTEIIRVSNLIDGGVQFIQVKDTMSLGSVVVSTLFYVVYLFYFWHGGFAIDRVNSKIHDALAIVLPMLLTEELAVMLSQVLLWLTWAAHNKGNSYAVSIYRTPRKSISRSLHNVTISQQAIRQLRHQKLEYTTCVNQQCLRVGVGARDMTGFSSLIASLWTFFFLIQGYIAEVKYGSKNYQNWMETVYWSIIGLSAFLVLFCYLPFLFKSSNELQEEFHSVAASCQAHLFLEHMTQLQDHLVATVTRNGTKSAKIAYPIVHKLRKHAMCMIDTTDLVSYALYVIALSTYDFFTGKVGNVLIRDLPRQPIERKHVLQPVNQSQSWYWGAALGEIVQGGNVDDALPTFLLRVPGASTESFDNLPQEMTLFSVPLMGIQTIEDVLIERNITNINNILENPLVQKKKIYLPPDTDDIVCIGLEVKIMEYYTTSIYIMAQEKAVFGHGRLYVTAGELESTVRLMPNMSASDPLFFVEVAEEDQLRAFAMCTLNIDPTIVRKRFKRRSD